MLVVNLFIFLLAAFVIWLFAGMLIGAISRISIRLHATGFIVAFFVLGLLTSISELSVAFNSLFSGTPQVSIGNLVGASFVIFLLIIPFLAFVGRGVRLAHTLSFFNLYIALFTIALPSFFVLDGYVSRKEGWIALFTYAVMLFLISRQKNSLPKAAARLEEKKSSVAKSFIAVDVAKVLLGGIGIFIAAHFLVDQANFFANYYSVPNSLIGLILLSIGTNVPEIVIAVRAIVLKYKDIAFGDYLGSGAMNTFIFGLLSVLSGGFFVERSEFLLTSILLFSGLIIFAVFANTKRVISRQEASVLLLFYVVFILVQLVNFVRFAAD